jgi:hypothetical protein
MTPQANARSVKHLTETPKISRNKVESMFNPHILLPSSKANYNMQSGQTTKQYFMVREERFGLLLPTDVTRVLDKIKVLRQVRENMKKICNHHRQANWSLIPSSSLEEMQRGMEP